MGGGAVVDSPAARTAEDFTLLRDTVLSIRRQRRDVALADPRPRLGQEQ